MAGFVKLKQHFKVSISFRSALREVPKESFFFQVVIFLIDMDQDMKRPNIIFMRQTSIRHLISVNVFPYAPLAWWDGGKRRNGGKACVCVASETGFQPVESNTGAYLKTVRAREEKDVLRSATVTINGVTWQMC